MTKASRRFRLLALAALALAAVAVPAWLTWWPDHHFVPRIVRME